MSFGSRTQEGDMQTIKKLFHSTLMQAIFAIGLVIAFTVVKCSGSAQAEEIPTPTTEPTVEVEPESFTESPEATDAAPQPTLALETVIICAKGDFYDVIYRGYLSGVPEDGADGAGLPMIAMNPSDSVIYDNPPVIQGNDYFYFVQRVPGTSTFASATVTLGYTWGNLVADASVDMAGNCVYDTVVEQVITSAVVVDCEGNVESGFVQYAYPEPVDTILQVTATEAGTQHGGPVVQDILIPTGITRYDFNVEQIAAFQVTFDSNENLPMLHGILTTYKGGGETLFEIGYLLTNEECVEVGEPPVPPTSEPVPPMTNAPYKALKTMTTCTQFTITNIGDVATGTDAYSVMLYIDNHPSRILGLQPGESATYTLEIGQHALLVYGDDWQVIGESVLTAERCETDEPIIDETPSPAHGSRTFIPIPDPAAQTLPATGPSAISKMIATIAGGAIFVGLVLVALSRRKKSSSWT